MTQAVCSMMQSTRMKASWSKSAVSHWILQIPKIFLSVSFHSFNPFCLALKFLYISSIYTRDELSLQQSQKRWFVYTTNWPIHEYDVFGNWGKCSLEPKSCERSVFVSNLKALRRGRCFQFVLKIYIRPGIVNFSLNSGILGWMIDNSDTQQQ